MAIREKFEASRTLFVMMKFDSIPTAAGCGFRPISATILIPG